MTRTISPLYAKQLDRWHYDPRHRSFDVVAAEVAAERRGSQQPDRPPSDRLARLKDRLRDIREG